MDAVFLDADSLGEDVDFTPLREAVTRLTCYATTPPDSVTERLRGHDTVLVNKVVLGEGHFAAVPELRQVAVTATGVNNIDLEAAKRHGVRVVNAIRYARPALVQHTFALILALAGNLPAYRQAVREGAWQKSPMFCLMDYPMWELEGRTLGIVGYGDLGQGVARMAEAFGMRVLVATRSEEAGTGHRLPLDELLPRVDVLSIHCLLSEETRGLIDARRLALMPSHALLINTARGGIVDEQALAEALKAGRLGGAGVDVLSEEPPVNGNPLLDPDIPNLIVTPHCAWATREARQRMVEQTADNLRAIREGKMERWLV